MYLFPSVKNNIIQLEHSFRNTYVSNSSLHVHFGLKSAILYVQGQGVNKGPENKVPKVRGHRAFAVTTVTDSLGTVAPS